VLRGALTPTVRRPWAVVDGRPVLAVGDAWIVNDPIVAQGANLGSGSAFVLSAAIAAGGLYDEAFAQRTEAALWAAAQAPTEFTNAFLAPPLPHVIDLLARASSDQALADRFVNGFAEPERMLGLLTPQSTAASTGPSRRQPLCCSKAWCSRARLHRSARVAIHRNSGVPQRQICVSVFPSHSPRSTGVRARLPSVDLGVTTRPARGQTLHSGLGKRVGGNPSRVQISYPPRHRWAARAR
jgi:hypothetical protein